MATIHQQNTNGSALGSHHGRQNLKPVQVYGYPAAWNLPDISPYVTKLIFWLKMTKTPYEHIDQNLGTLDDDAPYGKLPYIIDDDGTKVADSNKIIEYLGTKYGITLDKDLSPSDQAVAFAFERLVGEHLYWSGIIEPRWRLDEGFEIYIPYLVPGVEVTPEIRAVLDAFRQRILAGFNGQGMGRRPSEVVLEVYKRDIDVLSTFMANKRYFLGDRPRNIDAQVYAMLRHLVDQPQKWPGTGYIETKKNLMDYLVRMRQEYNM